MRNAGGSDGSGADQAWRWWRRGRRPHRQHGRRAGASREAGRGDRRLAGRDRRRSRGKRRGLRARIRPKGRTVTWPHREQLAFPSPLPGVPSVPVDLSSFSDLLRRQAPELLPVNRSAAASSTPGGVVMAGDRRSTQGNMIAGRDVQKVYITDDYTATGIAGTAAIAVEFARLYAVELEHYEKTAGRPPTVRGEG